MAYSDYGAFVYLNGERRTDKEDVGVYDTDEASLPHSRKFGWDDYEEYGGTRYAADKYDEEFDLLGWHFHFWGDDLGATPRYGATMSRDGETWKCDYDCMFGADFDDIH